MPSGSNPQGLDLPNPDQVVLRTFMEKKNVKQKDDTSGINVPNRACLLVCWDSEHRSVAHRF